MENLEVLAKCDLINTDGSFYGAIVLTQNNRTQMYAVYFQNKDTQSLEFGRYYTLRMPATQGYKNRIKEYLN